LGVPSREQFEDAANARLRRFRDELRILWQRVSTWIVKPIFGQLAIFELATRTRRTSAGPARNGRRHLASRRWKDVSQINIA
jgi:hypothetical protein